MKLSIACTGIVLLANRAIAEVIAVTDESQWQQTIGTYTTITFIEYPQFTTITDQYADLGITFTDGNDFIRISAFPLDDQGLESTDGFGNLGRIHMSFSQPQSALAFHFLGDIRVEFYNDGARVFVSNQYIAGFTPFVGFVSTTPFDAAVVLDPNDPTVAIGNIYFGPPIPAPGVLALFGLAAGVAFGRRRRS